MNYFLLFYTISWYIILNNKHRKDNSFENNEHICFHPPYMSQAWWDVAAIKPTMTPALKHHVMKTKSKKIFLSDRKKLSCYQMIYD